MVLRGLKICGEVQICVNLVSVWRRVAHWCVGVLRGLSIDVFRLLGGLFMRLIGLLRGLSMGVFGLLEGMLMGWFGLLGGLSICAIGLLVVLFMGWFCLLGGLSMGV